MINYFNFKQFNTDHLLITNDFGSYAFLTKAEMKQFLSNRLEPDSALYEELCNSCFILPDDNEEILSSMEIRYRCAKNYLFSATSLHIFVVTNNCNLNCVYCQARDHKSSHFGMMDLETARKAVDIALESPSKHLDFEFQGGEPLINFETIKFIVEYSEKANTWHDITYSIVTNLTLFTDEIFSFVLEHNIRISTSIDGPCLVHDKNRPFPNGNGSYEKVLSSLNRIREKGIIPGAIQTTTKYSLQYADEIVDLYAGLGFDSIFIRPLSKLGTARLNWDRIGYSPEEFLVFYKKCVDAVIRNCRNGRKISEGHAGLFLNKILNGRGNNYMELRSPCGAVLGQIAYYYDGNVFSCDEGRMVYEMGENAFLLGNVYTDNYESLTDCKACKALSAASTLETIPGCSDCVYQPYCGVCPVLNYASENNLFRRDINDYRCRIFKGMLDYVFELLYDNGQEVLSIISEWA